MGNNWYYNTEDVYQPRHYGEFNQDNIEIGEFYILHPRVLAKDYRNKKNQLVYVEHVYDQRESSTIVVTMASDAKLLGINRGSLMGKASDYDLEEWRKLYGYPKFKTLTGSIEVEMYYTDKRFKEYSPYFI